MRAGQGSRTAEGVAVKRAVHQFLDSPVVFEDPLAISVVRPEIAHEIRNNPRAFDRSPVAGYLRAFLAVRSRVAEDALSAAVARGVQQYVILGAGFDTFAYRNPYEGLQVFEVDHPDTQAAKRRRLEAAGIVAARTVRFIGVDLAEVAVGDALDGAGFDREAPSFFSWLGVVPYLELPAIRATWQFVASLRDSAIVFDYGVPPESFNWLTRLAIGRMAKRVASVAEPWKTFFKPADVLGELQRAGFETVRDVGPEELDRNYFAGRHDGLRVGRMGHIAIAATSP